MKVFKILKTDRFNFIPALLLTCLCLLFTPFSLSAQEESTPDNQQKPKTPPVSKEENLKKAPAITRELLRVNQKVSKGVETAAEAIDKTISPEESEFYGENKTRVYFVLGADVDDNGSLKTNFRYGAQLHLPRFERYWKLKFANQDEKRERGQSSATREQRTRNTNDDIFLGVSVMRHWDRVDVTYEPQIALNDGIGLDHSIEAETKFEMGKFKIEPRLEFFANHKEGTGSSGVVKFVYWFKEAIVAAELGTDSRYLFLKDQLSVNHFVGVVYFVNDRLNFSTHYFRSFANDEGYRLAAYGTYLTTNYMVYRNILSAEIMPYSVHERGEQFQRTNGFLVNFRINF